MHLRLLESMTAVALRHAQVTVGICSSKIGLCSGVSPSLLPEGGNEAKREMETGKARHRLPGLGLSLPFALCSRSHFRKAWEKA